MPFETNVFINCPFDNDYTSLLRPMAFTIVYLDYEPNISQTLSSSNIRIDQIKKHIKVCKYSIHDLSRCKAQLHGELPRFNMPFELGLDIGANEYGSKKLKSKKILILESEKYHYQKVLSDISGQDIEDHKDDPLTLILKVRNWFSNIAKEKVLVGHKRIWFHYNEFLEDLTKELSRTYTKVDIENMPIGDFIKYSKDWINMVGGSELSLFT
ncbi:MAG: hypothetical protein ABI844_14170 [Saprospiraceae bacterium]